jgi:signal transduction histidine kinase
VRERLDLAALGRSVAAELEPVAAAKNITLSAHVSGVVPVIGDAGWMQRLLLNLLDNAIKFTPECGRISVDVVREHGVARVEVSDTGIGIPPETVPHVFDRFYRADASRTTDGAGLGLSLVKWIADRHGASLELTSRVGQGSTFTLRMPIAPSTPAAPAAAPRK